MTPTLKQTLTSAAEDRKEVIKLKKLVLEYEKMLRFKEREIVAMRIYYSNGAKGIDCLPIKGMLK